MVKSGFRILHECDNCKARRMVSRLEMQRAAKPYCYQCGSTRLEPVSEEAKQALAIPPKE